MASLNPHQRRVLKTIVRIGRKRGESRREIKAAVATGLVESNLSNVRHGDADSLGWRQERASLYKNPLNLRASINRFYDETSAVEGQHNTAGSLAAAVQRPAAQYRGRYGERAQEAATLMRSIGGGRAGAAAVRGGGGGGGPGAPGRVELGRQTTFDEAGYEKARRVALVGGLIAGRRGTDSILFRTGVLTTQQPDPSSFVRSELVPKARAASTPATGQKGNSPLTAPGSQPDEIRVLMERANKIDRKRYPYVWGGGHATNRPDGGIPGGPGGGQGLIGFDCSGAVAAVLGINARHSSQFAKWGKAGRAKGGKGVTVYANNTHVLMEINGHFWGTSGANPRGGAGWIPRSAITSSYLSRFTARHM